jgi:hypothetical protein
VRDLTDWDMSVVETLALGIPPLDEERIEMEGAREGARRGPRGEPL